MNSPARVDRARENRAIIETERRPASTPDETPRAGIRRAPKEGFARSERVGEAGRGFDALLGAAAAAALEALADVAGEGFEVVARAGGELESTRQVEASARADEADRTLLIHFHALGVLVELMKGS